MRTVGIVGGIGPESTVGYYRQIIGRYRELRDDGSYPQIIINSIDMKRMLDLIGSGRLDEVAAYLSREVKRLEDAGADFGLLASNTPHIVFGAIQAAAQIPLLSIVEVACTEAIRLGFTRVGLFGTSFTMQGGFYQTVFARHGIDIVAPNPGDQNLIHAKYMGELVNGILKDATRRQLLDIAHALKEQEGIQGLILGGTELPLILTAADEEDTPFVDTTRLHVEGIVRELLVA